jgi:LysR family glycine cleavage system transcriptional activator
MLNDPGGRLPLNQLRVFAAVARAESFSQAAEMLNVSVAAVSAQVRALEHYLKTPLFKRGARRIELTPAGEILLPGIQRALEDVRGAIRRLREMDGREPLLVSVLASFLQRWLLPRLSSLFEACPELSLRFHTSVRPVDFAATDVQLAIRLGGGRWAQTRSVKLFDDWLLPACSPGHARRLDSASLSQAIRRTPLIESPTESWERYLGLVGAAGAGAGLSIGSRSDDSASVTEAACQGHGLALVRWSLAKPDFDAGRLVAPLGGCVKYWYSYYAVAPAGNFALGTVRQFLDWLKREAAQWTAPPG